MLLRVLKCIRIVSHVVELGRCTAVQVLINHNNNKHHPHGSIEAVEGEDMKIFFGRVTIVG